MCGPTHKCIFFNKYTAGPLYSSILHLQIQSTQMENSFLWGCFFQPSYRGLSHVSKGGVQSPAVRNPQMLRAHSIHCNISFYKSELSICGFGYLCVSPVTNPPWNSRVICGFFTVQDVSTPDSCVVQRSTVVGIKTQSREQQQSLSALGNRLCFLPYICIQPLCAVGCVMAF